MISKHHVTAVVFAAAFMPARLDPAEVRNFIGDVGHFFASHFGLSERREARDLGYYLDIDPAIVQRDKGVAELKRALALGESQQTAAALQSFDRAATLLPNLGDWISVIAAGVAATSGDTAEVTRRLEHVDSTLFTDWAWHARVRAGRTAGDKAGALQLAEVAARLPGYLRRRAEAWRTAGEIQLESGDTSAAARAFTNALDAWPYSDAALEAARLLAALPGLHPEHHLRIGRIYLRYGNLKRGVDGLHAYLASGLAPSDSAARIRLEIGRAYFGLGRYGEAQAELRETAHAAPAIASEALYLVGRSQYRAGKEDESDHTLHEVIERFPQQPAAVHALFLLGDLSQDDQEIELAAAYFQRATALAPSSEQAGVAHMRLSASALASGDHTSAIAQLNEYLRAFPSGARHQQAIYWLGRAQLGLGQSGPARTSLRQARDLDPFSFYGLRAADLINEQVLEARLTSDPVSPIETNRTVQAALLRFDLLRSIGWNDAATFELDRLRQYFTNDDPALYSLAEGFNERNRTFTGISIGRELQRRAGGAWNRRLLRIVYPMPYRDAIEKSARSHGISPYFMAALIRQESMFNPTATSSAGALGLMQVMPATGRSLARALGIRGFKAEMLFTPEVNLRIGSRFLADMIRTWNGRTDYVLASYNAGPTRVARWRQFPEAADTDLFLERIPFDETRDYVRVVQLNARIYETLYASPETGNQGGN